jgi:hypothetical protein
VLEVAPIASLVPVTCHSLGWQDLRSQKAVAVLEGLLLWEVSVRTGRWQMAELGAAVADLCAVWGPAAEVLKVVTEGR